jgi:hypothetical protein
MVGSKLDFLVSGGFRTKPTDIELEDTVYIVSCII